MVKVRPLTELARYRDRHKLTLRKLGEEFGVSAATVCRWETGRRRPDKAHVIRLSEMTGVSALEILGISEPRS